MRLTGGCNPQRVDRGQRGEFSISFQALIDPMLDDRRSTVSSQWQDSVWPPQANRFGWSSYLGDLDPDEMPIYAAAGRPLSVASAVFVET